MTLTQLQREGLASLAGGNLVAVSRAGRLVYATDQVSGASYTRQANALLERELGAIDGDTVFTITDLGREALAEEQISE